MPTKHLIPRASGEGGLGIPDITWGQAYYDTGNFNKGLFVSGKNIDEVIADAVTGGGLGGVWNTAPGGIIYYNGGNVGIGTTSPDGKLDVSGGKSYFQGISLKPTTGSVSEINSGSGTFGLQFKRGGTDTVRIDSAGNVGIGTTDPSTRMHIRTSGGSYSSSQGISEGLTIDDADQCSLNFYHSGTGSALSRIVGIKASSGNSDLAFITQNTVLGASTGRQEWMRITHTGNVGIGTTSPGAKLHVTAEHSDSSSGIDNLLVLESIEKSGQDLLPGDGLGILFKVPVDPTTSAVGARIAAVKEGGTEAATSTELVFEISQEDETLDEAMRIDRDGNVGIGTTTPSAKLEVKGEQSIFTCISAAGQRFCQSNWSSGSLTGHNGYISVDSGPNGDGTIQKFVIGVADAWIGDGFQGISIRCASSGVDSFIFKPNGNLYGQNWSPGGTISINGSGEIVTTSDKRLKNDLGDCEYGLNEVLQLKPKKYTWKDGPKHQESTIGFFAQDLHAVMEEAAPRKVKLDDKGNPVTDEDGEPDYDWGMNSNAIIAALVNSTKEQQQLIEDLKSRIQTLENK